MYYFGYGINLSHKRMLELCPNSKTAFVASLHHYRLIFTGWSRKWRGGVASLRRSRDDKVKGAIYELSESDLKSLDREEGYPAFSDRINVVAITKDGDPVEALTYIRREQSEETKPSREYLAVIGQGYKDWRIA
jgi:gamma-glutamylcyclotransferase (GGCT)/AIG2-like uncharacterized protein YtfP